MSNNSFNIVVGSPAAFATFEQAVLKAAGNTKFITALRDVHGLLTPNKIPLPGVRKYVKTFTVEGIGYFDDFKRTVESVLKVVHANGFLVQELKKLLALAESAAFNQIFAFDRVDSLLDLDLRKLARGDARKVIIMHSGVLQTRDITTILKIAVKTGAYPIVVKSGVSADDQFLDVLGQILDRGPTRVLVTETVKEAAERLVQN